LLPQLVARWVRQGTYLLHLIFAVNKDKAYPIFPEKPSSIKAHPNGFFFIVTGGGSIKKAIT
jgi:hypothetical protein